MRIVIAALAAAAVAGFAFSADAAPSTKQKQKQKHTANKERVQAQRNAASPNREFGYDATPEHYATGSREWWRAMEREGRGGFGDNM